MVWYDLEKQKKRECLILSIEKKQVFRMKYVSMMETKQVFKLKTFNTDLDKFLLYSVNHSVTCSNTDSYCKLILHWLMLWCRLILDWLMTYPNLALAFDLNWACSGLCCNVILHWLMMWPDLTLGHDVNLSDTGSWMILKSHLIITYNVNWSNNYS